MKKFKDHSTSSTIWQYWCYLLLVVHCDYITISYRFGDVIICIAYVTIRQWYFISIYIATILDSQRFWKNEMTFKVIQGHHKQRDSIENI